MVSMPKRPTRADLEDEVDRLRERLEDVRDQIDDVLGEDDDDHAEE